VGAEIAEVPHLQQTIMERRPIHRCAESKNSEKLCHDPVENSGAIKANKEFYVNIVAAVLIALLFVAPLLAVHLYAKAYVEPTIERSDDCKDPNSRPGSRADGSVMTRPS
jgi:hypothetical protein